MEKRKPRLFYGWIIVAAAGVVILVMYGTLATFGIFFEPVLTEFGWSRTMTAAAFSLVTVIRGSLYVVTGRLTDRYGPRAVVTICGFLLGIGYLLMSQMHSVWHFYLLYGVLVGGGMSSAWIPQVSTVARWFEKRRGLATGIAAAGEGIGILIMVPVAGWLISIYDWRSSYMAVGIISLVFITGAAQFLRRDPSQMGMSPYGGQEVKKPSSNLKSTGLSAREAIRTREFWLLSASYLFYIFCLDSIFAHIVIHASGLGISGSGASNILVIIGGMSVVGRLAMGVFADRLGSKPAIIICLALLIIDLLWLQLASAAWMLYLFAALFGFIFGGILIQFPLITSERYGLTSHGVIFGIISFVAMTGGALGPVSVGLIFDITGSYRLGFFVLAAASFIALILALLSRPITKRTAVPSA